MNTEIMRFLKKIIKRLLFFNGHLDKKYKIKSNTKFNHKTILEGYNSIGSNCNIENTFVGYGSYLGSNCNLAHARIGRFCSIASDVNVIIGTHPSKKFVSTHPSFFSLKKQAGFTYVNKNKFKEIHWVDEEKGNIIEIGNDVWIGNGVKILQGVSIGDGAIIGAGAILTKNVEPYAVYVGVPAQLLKFRFNVDDISFLTSSNWWNWDLNKIKHFSPYFEDIEKLKKKLSLTEF